MRNISRWSMARSTWVLALILCWGARVHAAGQCGNGVVEPSEECDPGGALHINGDPGLPTCATGGECFYELSCCKFNCQFVGQGAPCADANDCTDNDHCDQVGRCVGFYVPNGSACDDGVFCNGADTCQLGECVAHAGDPCAANTDCAVTCDEGSDHCDPTPFVSCGDDGNTCTDDVCDGSGVCVHSPLPGGTVCRAEATVCDIAETCPGGGAPCPGNAFVANGVPCGDQCTDVGTCQDGQCVGGTPLQCDDNNVCNGIETCDSSTGCVPGEPLDCADSNGCTSDLCSPSTGCSNPVLQDGFPCDDGERCTLFDSCHAGVCAGSDLQVVALKRALFGGGALGLGNIAVDDAKGLIKFGRGGFMADGSVVTAANLKLARGASVDSAYTNNKTGPGTVRGTVSGVTLPLDLSCAAPPIACDPTAPVIVVPDPLTGDPKDPAKSVVRKGPGKYGDVKIKAHGTLELDPGEYEFCNIKAYRPSALRPRGDVTIKVAQHLKASLVILEPYTGTGQIIVGRNITLGRDAEVHGMTLNAGAGKLAFGTNVQFDGAACAQKISARQNLKLGCPLSPPPP